MFLKHTLHLSAFESRVCNLRRSQRNLWSRNSLLPWKFCFLLTVLPYKAGTGHGCDSPVTVRDESSHWLGRVVMHGGAGSEGKGALAWAVKPHALLHWAKEKTENHHCPHANLMKQEQKQGFSDSEPKGEFWLSDHELFPAFKPQGSWTPSCVKVFLLEPLNRSVAYYHREELGRKLEAANVTLTKLSY